MSGKNRTIPLSTKEEVQVQTEVNLLNHQDRRVNSQAQNVRFSEIVSDSLILKSFSNKQVFNELNRLINDLKRQGNGTQNIQIRINLIEKQLEGLMKRSLLLDRKQYNQEAGTDYYSLINQKEKQLLKLQYTLSHNGIKVQRYETRIQQLQKQIRSLQKTVELTKNALIENKLYKQFVLQLREDKRIDSKKFTDLQKNLAKATATAKDSKGSQSVYDEIALDLSKYFITQIQKLQRQGKLSQSNLNSTIESFYRFNSNFNQQISTNFQYRSRYQQLKIKYQNIVSIFKNQIQDLSSNNPSIKGLKSLQNLIILTSSNDREIQFINVAGWIGIGKLSNAYVTASSSSSVQQTVQQKRLLKTFAKTLKSLIIKYPKIVTQLSSQVRFVFQKGEIFDQIIQSDSLQRLKQIITYNTDVIRVENVYQYDKTKQNNTIFNLRVLLKSIYEQLLRIKKQTGVEFTLDQGIIGMMEKQKIIEGIDVSQIIALYRPLPKIVEVERIVEKPVYFNNTLQKSIPIRIQKAIIAQAFTQKAVQVIKQVPVYIQKVVNNTVKQYVQVQCQNQKIVQVPTIRQVIADKILVNEVLKDIEVQKIVPLYQQKIIQVQNTRQIIVQKHKIVQIQKPIQLPTQKQYIQIQKIVQKPVYIRQTKQKIKQIQIVNEKIFQHDRYIQIERQVPFIITNKQTVYLDRQVPRFITNTEEKEVIVTEVIEKIVPYKVFEEKVIEVPVVQEKQIVREVEKEVLVEMTHFIKGDREQIIKQIQIIVQKPIREEVLIMKDLQIQKIVPLYYKEQKPIYIELQTPYIQNEPKIINQEIAKVVPVREQVIKEVRVEVPVPVIVQKEVVKVETVFVDRIVQKMVEVPRIVEIQRIVQKIVVVPRIIQKIVQVPRIIQKIITVQVPCLQIVQVFRDVPVIRQVQVIKQIFIDRLVIQIIRQPQFVDRQKIVQIVIQKEVPKQIQVQRRIPTQLIRQIPVQVFRDRIVEKIVEIHEVTVKDREVVVPFKHQMPVEFIVQKSVTTQKIVQNILKVPQIVQKVVPITSTITIPQIVEVRIQKQVQKQIIRQIPGPETIKYIQIPKQVQLLRQKIVQVDNIIQVPKQVYLYMDKIVHQYHQRLHPVHVPKIIQQPYIIEVSKPQHVVHYKQIPVQVQTNRNIPVRTIIDQIKEVTKEVHHQTEVEIFREVIKEIIKQNKQFIEREVEKEILREVVINETIIQGVEVPSEPKLLETMNTTIEYKQTPNYIEKVVERIVMLPQIVEVVKHIHNITQVQSAGVAVNTSIEEHTKQFTSINIELITALNQILQKFKQNVTRQPDLKNLIPIIQKNKSIVEKWISFPKLVQVQRQVQRIVQKQKVVLVPTNDHQKQASLSYLVEKLVTQLKRIKDRNRIQLQLDEDILRLFFKDSKFSIDESKYQLLQKKLKQQYASLGQWKQSYPFMINSFLQDYFLLQGTIQELNQINKIKKQKISVLQYDLSTSNQQIILLNSHNSQLLRNYSKILQILKNAQQYKKQLSQLELQQILSEYTLSKVDVHSLQRISETQSKRRSVITSSVKDCKFEQGSEGANKQLSTLISKTSKLQEDNIHLSNKTKKLEKQVKVLQAQLERQRQRARLNQPQSRISQSQSRSQSSTSNLKVIEQIKSRLITQNQQRIKRLQQSQTQQIQRLKFQQQKDLQRLKSQQQKQIQRLRQQKSLTSNSQLTQQNKKVNDQLRNVKRDLQTQKRQIQSLKQQHDRQMQNIKKQHQLNMQKKDSNISSIENVKARISEDYQKKIKQLKQVHERQLERFRASTTSKKDESPRVDKLREQKDKQVNYLRDKIKKLEIQLETSKKQIDTYQQQKSKMISTMYTGSVFTSGNKQASDIIQKERERQAYSPEHTKYSRIQTYQSAIQKKYVSPSSVKSKDDDASSRKSSSSKRSEKSSKYKQQMTLKQFLEMEENQDKDLCSTFIMIKIIEKIEQQAGHGLLHSFSPNNIYLTNLNPRNLESLQIKFGAPIVNKNNKNDGLYLAPQILAGGKTTQRSIVFTLAVIWDQLIHGQVYFKSTKDIQNPQHQFKVRDAKLNPILKNTLFEMMNKDSSKRLQLHQTKRRLSLQKYIASQSRR